MLDLRSRKIIHVAITIMSKQCYNDVTLIILYTRYLNRLLLMISDIINFYVIVSADVSISVSYSPPPDFTLPSPPYYRPATTVSLTCNAHGATGSIRYYWTSTCSSCFASGSYSQTISKNILTSSDAGIHTCTATDSTGTSVSASTEMKLYGKTVISK